MNKLAGDMQGLGYVRSDKYASSSSKTTFVPTSNKSKNIANLEPKDKGVLGQRTCRTYRTTIHKSHYQQSCDLKLGFIPTYHYCGALGHTRPRYHKLVNKS